MLIRNYRHTEIDTEDYEVTGLIKARRTIFFFVDKTALNNGTVMRAKCAVVNECVYDAKKSFTHSLVIDGSYIIRNAVYFGDVVSQLMGNITFSENIFALDNCVSKEKLVIPHGDTVPYDPNYYSVKMDGYNTCDVEASGISRGYDNINIPPQYYSDYHMVLKNGDYFDLLSESFGCKTSLKELMTHEAKVVMMDANKFDTIRLALTNRIIDMETECQESLNLNDMIGSSFDEFVGQGAIFIYDSNARGIGKNGVCVHEGFVPYGKWYNKGYLDTNYANALTQFSLNCEDIEKQYGSIRVMYAPDSVGNKYRVRFHDWNDDNQPIKSQIGNFDVQVGQKQRVAALNSIDCGYSNDRWITDTIRSSEKAGEMNFMAQMNGYI